MIDTDKARITLDTGVSVRIDDQRFLALSKKGLAAAFLATAFSLQNQSGGEKDVIQAFGEYHGLYEIMSRMAKLGGILSIELTLLENCHRPEIDDDFLSYVQTQLENED